jgi:CHAD domain-containing protein
MDLSCRLLAAKYIRRQAKQLAEQLNGLRAAEDVEFVHRARVATRRLRAALRMFDGCFAPKRLRRWRKAIRRTTARLSSARDRDVQIEFLCATLSALDAKDCFPGISRILVELERDRERLQRKVVKAVDRLEAAGILREMQRAAKKIPQESVAAENFQTPAACAQVRRHVLRQLDRLLRHQDSLASPDQRERHHAMRIATKRLRYTLEIARLVYPGRLDEVVETVKKVQTLLGDVHDCDVWVEHLDVFASRQRKRITGLFGHAGRFARLQVGIDYLRRERSLHRQELFGQLVAYWAELHRRRFWEGVAGVVLAGDQSSAGALPQPAGGDNTTAVRTSAPTTAAPASELLTPALMPQPLVAQPPVLTAAAISELQPAPGKPEVRPDLGASTGVWPTPRRTLLTTGS